tara:strand:- start:4451 stop:4927 length:477 start_codon:yes stop_codon:yes gene_type:complete
MNLSKNLSLTEATKSHTAKRHGLANQPVLSIINNLRLVAENVFQPLRDAVKVPIAVTSGYRSVPLNKLVGGARNSQHSTGHALDLDAHVHGGVTNKELFEYVRDYLCFDQLIWEYGTDEEPDWIHVSYVSDSQNRCRVLKAYRHDGRTKYKNITDGEE